MENRKTHFAKQIDQALTDEQLSPTQRKTFQAFDRFNDLEAQTRLSTRERYVKTVRDRDVARSRLQTNR